MFTRRFVVAAGTTAAPLAARAAAGAPERAKPPTVDELLAPPLLLDADLSPNGKQIAVLRVDRSSGKANAYVRLTQADDLTAKIVTVVIGEFDAYRVQWANDERLLVWVQFYKDSSGKPSGLEFYGIFIPLPVRRLISIDLTGSQQVVMFGDQKKFVRQNFDLAEVVDLMPDDPRHILMQIYDESHEAFALYQVDVYSGQAVQIERGGADTLGWFTQNGMPMLRYDSNSRGTVATVLARAPGEKDWKPFRKIRRDEFRNLPDFNVVAATGEAGVFLVCGRAEGEDRASIRKFDIRTLAFGEVVAHSDDHELDGVFMDMRQGLVATSFTDDRRGYLFTDPAMMPHFKAVNRFFDNDCNVEFYDTNLSHDRFLLRVTGPRRTGGYYLYDRARVKIEPLGDVNPQLGEERLARVEVLKVKTRDGAEITAYLTRPINAAAGPMPIVVDPHGGPEMRDSCGFDLVAQAFAAMGWLVLQPNFRGSGGYGKAFAEAGHRRWGDRMQDDVEDALAHVIASGAADPKRVAIWGASYGGYCALMQAVRRPDLYRAVVAVAGISDLREFLSFIRREDGADSPVFAFWQTLLGDPKVDDIALKAASPVLRAGDIKAPVLLIHGGADRVVDSKQSKIMAKALKDAGKAFEFQELSGEGHGDWSNEIWKTVINRSTAFIAKSI